MKRDLFKTLSLATLCSLMLAFTSCANEDIMQKKTDTDNNNDKNLTTFVTGTAPESRTSMDYNSGAFFWEAGDYIYVKDDDGTWQKSKNAPTGKTAYFKFKVDGKFNNSATYKVYYPGKNGSNDQVIIPTAQIQTEPNTTVHFGASGDCGIADATGTVGGKAFSFKLDHQAAYLVFSPHTSDAIFQRCNLTKIEVASNNNIARTYTISSSGLTEVSGSQAITLTTKGSGSYANGFPLNTVTDNLGLNGAYMVIAPGTHELTIRYWLKDPVTGIKGTITKGFSAFNYAANNYYDMWGNLDIRSYDGTKYYMWDAKQNYWYQHEWNSPNPWQPTIEYTNNPNYPQNVASDPDRWYNTATNPVQASQNTNAVNCPNVNEMVWYCLQGDPHWDSNELFTTMGMLKKGGMWIKKKDKITGFNKENYTDPVTHTKTDFRTTYYYISNMSIGSGQPSSISHYFYLPPMGRYLGGTFYDLGNAGLYWSSSSSYLTGDNEYAYLMYFMSSMMHINHTGNRILGARIWTAE